MHRMTEFKFRMVALVEFVLLDWFDMAAVLLNHQQMDCTHEGLSDDDIGKAHKEDAQIAEFLHQYFIGEPLEKD